MKTNKIISQIILFLFIISCSVSLPENFGVYVYSKSNFDLIKPQKTSFSGNLIQSISGVKGTSGSIYNKIDYIIVFEENIKSDDIKISKLKFNRGENVRNIFGDSYVEINLWTSERDIAINIAPIVGKKDMYKVTPIQPLDSGFYALHFGSLANLDTYSAFNKIAYDFIIGTNAEPYQSYEEIARKNEVTFFNNAERLLENANKYFNENSFDKIREIYLHSDGTVFNDNEWNTLTKGFDNWILHAGKIKSSIIIDKSINGNFGSFTLQSEYEKAGIVKEVLNVSRSGSSYYITFIGTN